MANLQIPVFPCSKVIKEFIFLTPHNLVSCLHLVNLDYSNKTKYFLILACLCTIQFKLFLDPAEI